MPNSSSVFEDLTDPFNPFEDLTDPFNPVPEIEEKMGKKDGNARKILAETARSARDATLKVDINDYKKALALLREMEVAPLKPKAQTIASIYEWRKPSFSRYVAPDNIRRRFELHLLPAIGHHTSDTLLPEYIEAMLNALEQKPLRADYLNKIRADGHALIRDAMANKKWHGGNPFDAVRPRKVHREDQDVLTADEARGVLEHVRRDMQNMFALMVYLGPRPGEMVALQKKDVDLVRRTIDFMRSHERDTTKTGRRRKGIPIPDELYPYIENAMRTSKTDLVFPSEDGDIFRFDFKFSRVLRGAMVLAGAVQHWTLKCRRKGCGFSEVSKLAVESYCPRCNMRLWAVPTPRPIRFYDLRHTAASLHEKAGCKPIAYKKAMGWAAQDVSERTYVHLTDEDMRYELNKLSLNTSGQNPETSDQNPKRRKGFEPSTPSLGRSGRNRRTKAIDGRSTTNSTPVPESGKEVSDSRSHVDNLWLSVSRLAKRWDVSVDVIYKWVEEGRLPHIRLGNLIRFDVEKIEALERIGGLQ